MDRLYQHKGEDVTHSSYTVTHSVERYFSAPPALVYRAWSDPHGKAEWFGMIQPPGHDRPAGDFRVGGRERYVSQCGSDVIVNDIVYRSIIPGETIVFECRCTRPDGHTLNSVTSVDFHAEGCGTRLTLNEKLLHVASRPDRTFRAAAGFC